jgi:hypothetical protein
MTDAPRRWVLLRSLRSVASVFCFTLAVALVLLWVRSYWWHDWVYRAKHQYTCGAASVAGRIRIGANSTLYNRHYPLAWHPNTRELYEMARPQSRIESAFRFEWNDPQPGTILIVTPHWVWAAIAGSLTFVLRARPRRQFSVFDFLVFTTFVALLAGALAILRYKEPPPLPWPGEIKASK